MVIVGEWVPLETNALAGMAAIFEDLDRWRRNDLRAAIARVVDIDGGGTVRSGAALAVNERGEVTGSVPDGCPAAAVVAEVLDVLGHGHAKLVTFGRRGDGSWHHLLVEPLIW